MADNSSLVEKPKTPGIETGLIHNELLKIIDSRAIKSDRHRKFLSYIVEETLAGRSNLIKAYSIATEVFKRGDDFDAAADPIVRVEAGRLRRALENYYLTDGKNDSLRIEIPKGGYLPEFRMTAAEPSHKVYTPAIAPETNPTSTLPTVIVLPFQFQGDDTAYEYFSSGLAEEITNALTRCKGVRVISAGHIQNPEITKNGIHKLTPGLDARFYLCGTIRAARNTMRISIHMHDIKFGEQIWSERYCYDNDIENLLLIQDDITQKVIIRVADIYDGIIPRTISKESRHSKAPLSTYDAILRHHHYNHTGSADDYRSAIDAITQATKDDSNNALAWASLSELIMDGFTFNYTDDDIDSATTKALKAARKAISLDRTCDHAYWALGYASVVVRDTNTIASAVESLLEINPPASLKAHGGWLLALIGDWERGIDIVQQQMQILYFYPGWLNHVLFLNHYRQNKYEDALKAATKFNMPELVWDPIERAAALGQLGKTDIAKLAVKEITSLQPGFVDNPRRYLKCFIMQDELVEHVLEGLLKAGLPENSATP